MVRRLAVGRNATEDASGIERRREDHLLKHRRIHMVRTAKRRQRAAGLEQLSARR